MPELYSRKGARRGELVGATFASGHVSSLPPAYYNNRLLAAWFLPAPLRVLGQHRLGERADRLADSEQHARDLDALARMDVLRELTEFCAEHRSICS
jgi:hypothetical protein